jgi:hypothetical protein
MNMIRSWIDRCNSDHDCFWVHSDSWLPTRLIDIHAFCSGDAARLIAAKTNQISDRRYVALSHCWGNQTEKIPRTLKANQVDREEGIEVEALSKTFQDAIAVTKALGMKYIWIDSLCTCRV